MKAAVHHGRCDRAKSAGGQVLGRRNEVGCGVVDQSRQRRFLPNRLDHRINGVGIANVASVGSNGSKRSATALCGGRFEQGNSTAADVDVCAALCQGPRDLLAQSASTTGDKDNLADERVVAE